MASLDDQLVDLLRTNRIGRVATIKRDGRPQLSNVIYAWDDDARAIVEIGRASCRERV